MRGESRGSGPAETASAERIDRDLFPPAFLRLLNVVPPAVVRLRVGASEGRRAAPGEGGRFLFRGHRSYRPGDDLRHVDWKVAARLDRYLVRQYDAERDFLTEVWLDGSASMAPFGGRIKSARVTALACAIGLASGGRTRLGRIREGRPQVLLEGSQTGRLPDFLHALSVDVPSSRADLAQALPRLVKRTPRGARVLLVSDLLSRAEPGILRSLAGRGLRGALLHLRVPQVTAPNAVGRIVLRDAETGTPRAVVLDAHAAARVAERARRHAERWARHASAVGLQYIPFAPSTADESLLRRVVEDVS